MRIIKAEAMGMCFGVRNAIDTARKVNNPDEVTIYGELVHNRDVLNEMADRGFITYSENLRTKMPDTQSVLITAHGISDAKKRCFEAAGKRLIDTTCPLVRRVHAEARSLEEDGYFVVIIGKHGHVEVQGITGDLERFAVIECMEDIQPFTAEKIGVVCQSTAAYGQALLIVDEIRRQNPDREVRFIHTICRPTLDRQQAMSQLLNQVEAVVVVGGRNSNNTKALVQLARQYNVPALHVETATDVNADWVRRFSTIGLTAGTSTPQDIIDEVYQKLESIAASSIESKVAI